MNNISKLKLSELESLYNMAEKIHVKEFTRPLEDKIEKERRLKKAAKRITIIESEIEKRLKEYIEYE